MSNSPSDYEPRTVLGGGAFGLDPGIPKNIFRPSVWKFGPATYSDIFIPPQTFHLFQAVDALGRRVFGVTWTGDEIAARDLSGVLNPLYASGAECVEQRAMKGVPFLAGLGRPYRALTTTGFVQFDTADEAIQAWDRERPKLVEMYEREKLARQRFCLTAHSLRKFLYAGHFPASVIDPRTGFIFPIAPFFWGSDPSVAAFELRNAGEPLERPRPRIKHVPSVIGQQVTMQQGYVIVDECSFLTFLRMGEEPSAPADAPAEQVEDATGAPDAVEPVARKSKGGRPSIFDADAFVRELLRIANTPDGLPGRRELRDQMREWCTQRFGREPADSTLRALLRRFVPAADEN